MIYRNPKFLKLLREIPCQHCGIEDGSVCAAHRNEGKGMGIKVSDALVAALCLECHYQLDNGRHLSLGERREMWNNTYIKTMKYLIEHEMIKCD